MDNSRYRLITSIVILFIYLLSLYPLQTIFICIVLGIAYLMLSNVNSNTIANKNYGIRSMQSEIRRRESLRIASIYLSPFEDIWKSQKLSNKYCSLSLGSNGKTIIGKELKYPNRHFRIVECKSYTRDNLWDKFLVSFKLSTDYDKLIELCTFFNAEYKEYGGSEILNKENTISQNQTIHVSDNSMPLLKVPELNREKIDVNNASEAELTALPGVNIITAKKLIKKREELKGFKSIDEVLSFLSLKPHMINQIKDLICVKSMRVSDAIKRYNERKIDL